MWWWLKITRVKSNTPRIKIVCEIKRSITEIGCEVVDIIDVVSELVQVLVCSVMLWYVRLLLRNFCFNVIVLRYLSFRLNFLLFILYNIVKYSIIDRKYVRHGSGKKFRHSRYMNEYSSLLFMIIHVAFKVVVPTYLSPVS